MVKHEIGDTVWIEHGSARSRIRGYPEGPMLVKLLGRVGEWCFKAIPVDKTLTQECLYYCPEEIIERTPPPRKKGRFVGERVFQF